MRWAKGYFEDGYVKHVTGGESKETHDTFWVNGGSGVFRKSMWIKLGGMDDKLFSPYYWEDNDLSYRAMKRGWITLWEPRAYVVHKHESTTQKIPKDLRNKIQERNQLLFIWKNLTSSILFRKHIAGLFRRIIFHPGYLRILIIAVFKFKRVARSRAKEKREAKVSDEAIFAKFKND